MGNGPTHESNQGILVVDLVFGLVFDLVFDLEEGVSMDVPGRGRAVGPLKGEEGGREARHG